MKILILCVSLLPILCYASERIVLCGGNEVFMIDPNEARPTKVWSWRAKDHPEIPAQLSKAFGTTDDCKPIDQGKRLLVSSSGGGCALLELPSGKPLWSARVSNAHSIEALPEGRIIVASSTGATGNKLVLFDQKQGDRILWEASLHSAHGVVWDTNRRLLWALGYKELRAYSLKNWSGEKPELSLESTHSLPDDDGHELSAVPRSHDLIVSTHASVWLFNREQSSFRPHPDLADRAEVKCVDPHPKTNRLLVVQASGQNWWTDTIEFQHPTSKTTLAGERLYKGRWLIAD